MSEEPTTERSRALDLGSTRERGIALRASQLEPTSDEVAQIVRDHGAYVWRTLRFMGVREADLEDLCQEVFIVVCRKLASFEGRSSLEGWLRGICVKMAAAHRRRAHVRNEVAVATPNEELAPDCPERRLERRHHLVLLDRALDTLDDDKRAVFTLYEIEELSMQQVADALGCPLQTAYSRYRVARERVVAFVRRAAAASAGAGTEFESDEGERALRGRGGTP